MNQEVALCFEHISKTFPGVKALDDVSFQIKKGTIHILLGENGAGKSTLMKILTGVYPADSGTIWLDGKEIRPEGILESRKLGIGTVFQENSLVPDLSVAENVFLTREPKTWHGLDWEKIYADCGEWCSKLGIDLDPKAKVKDLTVAQQQIVEIVKVFSQDPKLVVLDEPTSALSENEISNLFRIVKAMKAQGITFIYISHRLEELSEIGDSCTVLRDGKFIGTVDNIKEIERGELIRMIVGRPMEEQFPQRDAKIGELFFEAKNITVPGLISDISFNVHKGEIVGVAGLVGAGRTTLAKACFGELKYQGKIYIDGKEVSIKSPIDAIGHHLGYLPEDRKTEGLFLDKTVAWNISLPNIKAYKGRFSINKKKELEDVKHYSAALNVKTPSLQQDVVHLSGGNQQKVAFAKWLCGQSQIYFFDEPTRGIDVGSKREIYEIINRLADQGNAILMISSELPELIGICDRIYVLYEGRMSGCIERKDATQEAIMTYALGGSNEHQD
jgi:ribose transport system ATP-binding protein